MKNEWSYTSIHGRYKAIAIHAAVWGTTILGEPEKADCTSYLSKFSFTTYTASIVSNQGYA
jgi:hypothetical protein